MSTSAASGVPKIADSKSLHNYTLSPGWTKEEVEILKIALMKFGIGKWKKIQKSGCLPSKTISQMNLQTQRLLGQQSLAEFMGLHVYLDQVFLDNAKKNGPEIIRKNNFIINTGDNLTAKEREKRIKLNKQKYGVQITEIKALKLPKTVNKTKEVVLTLEQIFNAKSNFSVVEQLQHLGRLQGALETKLRKIEHKKAQAQVKKLYRPLGVSIILGKTTEDDGIEGYEYIDTVDNQ